MIKQLQEINFQLILSTELGFLMTKDYLCVYYSVSKGYEVFISCPPNYLSTGFHPINTFEDLQNLIKQLNYGK